LQIKAVVPQLALEKLQRNDSKQHNDEAQQKHNIPHHVRSHSVDQRTNDHTHSRDDRQGAQRPEHPERTQERHVDVWEKARILQGVKQARKHYEEVEDVPAVFEVSVLAKKKAKCHDFPDALEEEDVRKPRLGPFVDGLLLRARVRPVQHQEDAVSHNVKQNEVVEPLLFIEPDKWAAKDMLRAKQVERFPLVQLLLPAHSL
jgi:hypothetical protein